MVHGTLSWYGQETIAALQKNLKAHGHRLSRHHPVARHRRPQRTRRCDVVHDYALAGAKREVGLWLEWLEGPGCQDVDLLGFSRGGAQVATFAPELAQSVRKVVLLAPAFATVDRAGRDLQARLRPRSRARDRGGAQEPAGQAHRRFPDLQAGAGAERDLPRRLCRDAAAAWRRKTGHPTLVVVAGKDEVVPDLAKRLPSDVKPVVIDGADHFFHDLYGEEAADGESPSS